MRSMRDIMMILEGGSRASVAQPDVAASKDGLAGQLMSLQGILAGVGHGFAFSTDWVDALLRQARQAKLDHEASEAQDRARHDAADGEFQGTPYDLKAAFAEIADRIAQKEAAGYSIHSDTRWLERQYQDRKTTDPDNPMDFVEDSDFLRFMRAQDAVAHAIDAIVPSKPSTFKPFVQSMEAALHVYGDNRQDEELIWSENLQKLVSRYIPFLIFCLKSF